MLPAGLPAQLSSAYSYKELADYDTERFDTLTLQAATDAIAVATSFVASIRLAIT